MVCAKEIRVGVFATDRVTLSVAPLVVKSSVLAPDAARASENGLLNVRPERLTGTSSVTVVPAATVPLVVLVTVPHVATPPASGYVPGPDVITHGAVDQFCGVWVVKLPLVWANAIVGSKTKPIRRENAREAVMGGTPGR
jgi:hypothetical protein